MGSEAVFGIDREKAGDQALNTGISTRAGTMMPLTVNNSPAATDAVHEVCVVQVHDGIIGHRRAALDVE